MSKEKPMFWAIDGDERLSFHTIHDRLIDYFECASADEETPETFKMVGYDMVKLPPAEEIAKRVLENLIEYLDEEYSMSLDEPSDETDKMKAAALEFAKIVIDEYQPFDCEPVCETIVNVSDYLSENEM